MIPFMLILLVINMFLTISLFNAVTEISNLFRDLMSLLNKADEPL